MRHYRSQIEAFFNETMDLLYPERLAVGYDRASDSSIRAKLLSLLAFPLIQADFNTEQIVQQFMDQLQGVKSKLDQDILATYDGDPAAVNRTEVILAYPGFWALSAYRIANVLYQIEVPLIPRIITEIAHSCTGIDIHPGAQIGTHMCIDHGTGIVIGETAIIGNHVKLYQGVTLGALSIPKHKSKEKRHPTIEDHVVIYAQATILGGKTTIGKHSIIGGNVWITQSVKPHSKVIYAGCPQEVESNDKSIIFSA